MNDIREVRRVAERLIAWRGDKAYAYAREQAEIAKDIRDRESAITWWDIARAIIETRNISAGLPFLATSGLERVT